MRARAAAAFSFIGVAVVLSLGAMAHVHAAPPASSSSARGRAAASAAKGAGASEPLKPLNGDWLEGLESPIKGYVSPPTGATEPRPVVIAVHGAGDRPDWACSEWRAIFGPVPFIVCPRGSPLGPPPPRWGGASALHVARATDEAMRAVARRFSDHLDRAAPRVYAGFSQGARLGAGVIARAPSKYPYAIFLEGLGDVDKPSFARTFHAGGGRRLVLACSQAGCAATRQAAARALRAASIETHVLDAGPVGHTVNGAVIAAVRGEVPWLLAGDRAWAPAVSALTPR
jgi:predicted esterase